MRPEKKSIGAELTAKVKGAGYIYLADYKGLSVAKTSELRKQLKGASAKIQVVKNRVFKHVLKEAGVTGLDGGLKGSSAMIYGSGDPVATAKILKDFIKANEKPVIKIGSLQGSILSAKDVEALAAMPSREIMLGKVVGTIAAPMSQLVGVLNQKVASVLYVLKAIEEKKGKAAA
jgi:large subunit ribosomal protein L10